MTRKDRRVLLVHPPREGPAADAYLVCSKETISLSFSDLSHGATSLQLERGFVLQMVRCSHFPLLQIKLISAYSRGEQRMTPPQSMRGQACICPLHPHPSAISQPLSTSIPPPLRPPLC